MDFFEIPIGKFIVSLCIFRMLVVNSKIPYAVFGKTVLLKVFLLCGRSVLTPSIPLVEYKSLLVDKLFGMVKCSPVECHGHH